MARRRLCQQQVRNIGARNHQHKTHSTEQDEERGFYLVRHHFVQRHGDETPFLCSSRIQWQKPLLESLQLRISLFDGNSCLEASKDGETMVVSRGPRFLIKHKRYKKLRLVRRQSLWCQHANDRVCLTIESNIAINNAHIVAEPSMPQLMGYHHDLVVTARLIFVESEATTEQRCHVEYPQIVCRNLQATHAFRRTFARQIHVAR